MPLHTRDAAQIAAQAWDATHEKTDPDFDGCSPDHRHKLIAAVEAVESTGYDDAAGLEAFTDKVRELLAAEATDDTTPKQLSDGKHKKGKGK